jgi:hypothetical protein
MITEIEKLLTEYHDWLKQNTSIKSINDWCEITTPYLDRHNDHIQIFVKSQGNKNFILSDAGYTINDLALSGCQLDTPKRKSHLNIILNSLGIRHLDSKLEVSATTEDFSFKKHRLLQAILAVNDLFYSAKPNVIGFFLEDVGLWLKNNDVRFTPNIIFSGKSGYEHNFHYVIPESKEKPERIIQTLNEPSKNSVETFLFAWSEIKDLRPSNSIAYAVLNDRDHNVSSLAIEALTKYNVIPITWSEKAQYIKELAA